MILLESFGNKIDKTTILKTWKNHNQIFIDTRIQLQEICATSNLNELIRMKHTTNMKHKCKIKFVNDRLKELKVLRRMRLHILWNILKYPKYIKYQQINKQALYNKLLLKCHLDLEQMIEEMKVYLQQLGFKKRK
ncbi:hypothetical protein RFI_01757 [Reticulomyxa filosa]|uniref:Uncharacterized protein n=1 Tax=Reticulomyxa filosa TaxID=46433 RepID=X6PCB4_RETFI|nr:hypothetical protein RFI_01757 [Reticulomyxa filosa]|eukprot:ETO35307.1 hypothetical protein RFI_01757 [Reticulomyxa filosa]